MSRASIRIKRDVLISEGQIILAILYGEVFIHNGTYSASDFRVQYILLFLPFFLAAAIVENIEKIPV